MGECTCDPLRDKNRQGKRFATYPSILQYCTCYALAWPNGGLPIARLYVYKPEAALY
jgi:hypothetical protein